MGEKYTITIAKENVSLIIIEVKAGSYDEALAEAREQHKKGNGKIYIEEATPCLTS